MKKRLLTTALLIFVVLQGYAQRFDYENTSKVFFGLNIGSVWHTSDVENAKERFPLGAGFVFGGSINQNYGNALSFDIRFRYLGGTWYGKDSDTTSAIQNNYAVKPLYDTLGYTVQNFRSVQHRFALELSLHANRFKERTGIDPYIFGGIGFTASNINGDLLKKSDGTIYPYNETPNGSIIDEKYKTPLDMNAAGDSYTADAFDLKVLPSLGVGIGYYFSNRFSMGVEHKTTFFLNDYFDGTTVSQEGKPSRLLENDLYHYTSIYFKWYLRGGKNKWEQPIEDNTNPVQPQPQTPNVPPTRKDKPVVDFTNPSNSPHRTNSPNFDLRANVKYVSSEDWITFTGNHQRNTNFTFNPKTQSFQANVELVPGLNSFFLMGENQYGKSRDLVEIYYEKEERGNPPIVKITNPSLVPYYINQLNHTVQADIRNIKARNQIKVTFNDQVVTNFSFNENANNNFSIPLNLKSGKNTLIIEGKNNYGVDSDKAIIIYKRETIDENGFPPIVNILTPSRSPYTTTEAYESILAEIKNIDRKEDVQVRVNGVLTSNFAFNRKANSNATQVQFNAVLVSGTNTVRITASNAYGNDFDETQIIYRTNQPVGYPPVVKILTPSKNPYSTTQLNENIVAKVEHITSKNQIKVLINGVQTNNFTFTSSNNRIQLNASLKSGTNTIRISASNAYGNDFDETQIIYRSTQPIGYPPIVKILTPSTSPYTTAQLSENIVAKVENVKAKNQMEVFINGVQTNNFTFTSSTSYLQVKASLKSGTNTIRISASNNYGNDFDEALIIYRRKLDVEPPHVSFVAPANDRQVVTLSQYIMIAKTKNVFSKNSINLHFNGEKINPDLFTFNPQTQTVQYSSLLKIGENNYKVTVDNNDGFHEATTNIERKQININQGNPNENELGEINKPDNEKCLDPLIQRVLPKNLVTDVYDEKLTVRAIFKHIKNINEIELTLNDQETRDFLYHPRTQVMTNEIRLKEGENTYTISLRNDCSTVKETFVINYIPPACGALFGIELTSDFCLITDSQELNSDNLKSNPNFKYSGPAKSLYIKALANGTATVNGSSYKVVNGNYYQFMGNMTVDIAKNSNGQWSVCVSSIRPPVFGKGKNKPISPCTVAKSQPGPTNDNKNVRNKPDERNKPDVRNKPNIRVEPTKKESSPPIRTAPNIKTESPENKKLPTSPQERQGVSPRTIRGAG